MNRFIVAMLVLAGALALAACGSSESDEDKITSAIETTATSTDPAICEEAETLAFVEQSKSGEGKEAVEECEESTEEGKGNPDSVAVSEVEVEGEEASAAVAFTGGSFDGQAFYINLVEEEGDWKLDEIESFKSLNREKLIAAFEGSFEESEVEPELAECVIEVAEELSDSELEEVVLTGSEGGEELAEECVE